MYVGGSVISTVEFHGNMSLVLFMSKCPLACRYCHNVELLEDNTEKSFEEIKQEIDFVLPKKKNGKEMKKSLMDRDETTCFLWQMVVN